MWPKVISAYPCSYPLGSPHFFWVLNAISLQLAFLETSTSYLISGPTSLFLSTVHFLHHNCGLASYSQRYEKGWFLSSSSFWSPQEPVTFLHILGSSQYHSSMSQWHREYDVTPASQNSGQKADAGCPLLADPGTQHSHLFLDRKQDYVYLKNIQLKLFFQLIYSLSSQWVHHQFHSRQN